MTKEERAPFTMWDMQFEVVDDVLYNINHRRNPAELTPYIPKALRMRMLQEQHASPLAGHNGGQRAATTSSPWAWDVQGRPRVCT